MRQTVTVLLALCLLACGASGREKSLRGTLLAVNSARDGFVAWDAERQQAIVASATNIESGTTGLAEYRRKREPTIEAFTAAYRAVAIAAVMNDDPSLASVLDAARRLLVMLDGLGCTPCGKVTK